MQHKKKMKRIGDTWNSGDPYEYFMGRWSQLVAPQFLEWLNFPSNLSWLDLGCGTGALSEAIYRNGKPAYLSCIDPSAGFLEKAKERLPGKADFAIGSASDIPNACINTNP
jgi:ubiquinone/menaquinone biosynthesis C-methylase UbiE